MIAEAEICAVLFRFGTVLDVRDAEEYGRGWKKREGLSKTDAIQNGKTTGKKPKKRLSHRRLLTICFIDIIAQGGDR